MIAKGNFGIKTTARSSSLKSSESRHETLIPHDAVILDVLEKLGPAAKNSVANAKRETLSISAIAPVFPKEIEANSIQPMIPFFETLLAPQLTSMDKKQKNALLEIVKSF